MEYRYAYHAYRKLEQARRNEFSIGAASQG